MNSMTFYAAFSRFVFQRSYVGKVMFVTFLGIHIPLIALLVFFVLHSKMNAVAIQMLLVALAATLIGTLATIAVCYALLTPITKNSQALNAYLVSGVLPRLPTDYKDEVGLLMADVQCAILRMDDLMTTLAQKSSIDYLTGALNRASSEQHLQDALDNGLRSRKPFVLVLLDVDRFKQVNDQYGHPAGDECLKHVVRIIQEEIRLNQGDWLGRWGGDEFIMGMEDTFRENATLPLQRIQTRLQNSPYILPDGKTIALTLSIGAYVSNGKELLSTVVARADKALYAAKKAGRNRICFFSEQDPDGMQAMVS